MRRILTVLGFIVLCLGFAPAASAGGWAVVTLEELPAAIRAGETYSFGFTIRAHGQTPVDGLAGAAGIEVVGRGPGERAYFPAQPGGRPGLYTADVTFPAAGAWELILQPGPYPVTRIDLLVVGANADTWRSRAAGRWPLLLGALALTGAGAGLARRRGAAWSLTGPLALIAGGALAGLLLLPAPVSGLVGPSRQSLAGEGRLMFAAKGCVSCHHHAAVPAEWSTLIGPNLSAYRNSAEFLRTWLKDPAAVRPETAMPNLELN